MANQSNNWNTPPELLELIKDYYRGTITLDPCSNKLSQVKATVEYCLPVSNGLEKPWVVNCADPTHVFFNPPYAPYYYSEGNRVERSQIERAYGQVSGLPPLIISPQEYKDASQPGGYKRITIGDWIKKAYNESLQEPLIECIGLIPARGVGNSTWQKLIWKKTDAICFLNKRYPFWENGLPAANSGTFDLALVYFGTASKMFREYFAKYGHVVLS